MEFKNFLENNPSINVTINAEQLIEVIDYAISKTKSEFEARQIPEQYLTRKQTAEKLGVDLSSLWRWQRQGYLVPIEVGGKRLYKLSDINKIYRKDKGLCSTK